MFAGFMALSAAKKLTRIGIVLGAVFVIGLLFYLWLDAYGDRRYKEGVQATDQKWVAAGEQLKKDAAKSATKADDRAAERLANEVANQTADKEEVDEALRNGSSPLDVLFGA